MIRSKKPLIAFTNYHSQEALGSTLVDTVCRVASPATGVSLRTEGGRYWAFDACTRCASTPWSGLSKPVLVWLLFGSEKVVPSRWNWVPFDVTFGKKSDAIFVYFLQDKKYVERFELGSEIRSTEKWFLRGNFLLNPPGGCTITYATGVRDV